MEDKVGSVVPSEREIEQLLTELRAIKSRLERYTIVLRKEERGGTVKFRPGGEAIVELVGNLAEQHGVVLPQAPVDGMRADLTLSQRLAPVAALLGNLTQRVEDTILEARSECWWANTANYSVLARMAPADPQLEAALRPVVEFFANARRGRKTAATSSQGTTGSVTGTK